MLRKIFTSFTILFFLSGSIAFGQGYKIEVELPNSPNKEVKLTYHYLNKVYPCDTTLLDTNGKGVFAADTLLPQGLYKILIDKDHHFDFLLGSDQQFVIKATYKTIRKEVPKKTIDKIKLTSEVTAYANLGEKEIQESLHIDIEVQGSKESEAFVNYVEFFNKLKAKGAELNQELKTAPEAEKEGLRNELNGLTTKLHNYWENVGEELPSSFLYKFLKANYVPALDISTLPEEVQQNDSLLLIARFNFQREHFWDNFDYTDERFLYTPFYKTKLETWFNKVLYPAYDSVKPYVYQFLHEVESNKRIFQFATSSFLNGSINSKVMGMDALFVDIAQDYYLAGKAFWANDESLEKIRENILFIKDNLIGKIAPDLTLENYDGEYINLHQLESDLTLVVIYEPNCGHCKVVVPKLYKEVYLPNKDKSLQVYAIYSMDNKEEWTEFLAKHNMFEWHNVWDPNHNSRFKILYDARKTPGVYVLNQEKEIIAKKMPIEQVKKIVADKLQ